LNIFPFSVVTIIDKIPESKLGKENGNRN